MVNQNIAYTFKWFGIMVVFLSVTKDNLERLPVFEKHVLENPFSLYFPSLPKMTDPIL